MGNLLALCWTEEEEEEEGGGKGPYFTVPRIRNGDIGKTSTREEIGGPPLDKINKLWLEEIGNALTYAVLFSGIF